MADAERITVRHPSHGKDGPVNDSITREAFEQVLKPLGWVEVKPESVDPAKAALDEIRVPEKPEERV